jgi:colanic acid/amylovoran biosynthesis protein
VALSVSQGIIKYSGLDHDAYYSTFARLCDALIDAGKKVILIPHVMEKNPDNNDVIACDEVLKRMTHLTGVVVVSGEPSAVDFKGIIGCCECLIGTRTHATIAAMSQGVPTVSIAYSRKAHGIMKDVYGDELGAALTVEARDITPQILLSAYERAVASRIDSGRLAAIKDRAQLNFTVAKALLS